MLIRARHHRSLTLQTLLGRALALSLLLLVGISGHAQTSSIAFVQSNTAQPHPSAVTVAIPFTLAQIAGDLNVVVVGWNDSTAQVSSVMDSMGNSYSVAVGPTVQTGLATQTIYFAKNILSAGANANVVTVTFSGAANSPDIRIAEYAGLDTVNPLDIAAATQGNSALSNSGPVTTANASDLLVGANLVQSVTTGPGTGFTARAITNPDGDILEDRVVSSTGSYNATATLDIVQPWIMQIAAFRAAGGSGPVPNIASLNPTSGPVGTSVTITGSNFGASQGTSTVKFNGTTATPASWTAASIVVPVPGGATSGSVIVTVAGVASNGVIFTVIPTPSISTLNPTSGPVGASVTIGGTNFGATQGTSTVTFSGTVASPSSWTATSIVVPVPTGAATGNVVATVNGVASNGVNFTVLPTPAITSLSPTSAAIGASVTITGTNFGASQGTSTVTFNGIMATPTSWNATSVAVPVPNGATTGNVVATVNGVASNGVPFTVTSTAPSITSLNPISGVVGTSVTIGGLNFGPTQGSSTVTFNGTAGTPVAWSATSINVPVPTGATTGNVVITVGGQASNGISFTVTPPPPSIASLNPTSGVVGTSVTITGANFGPTQGTSTVTFNGTVGTPTAWSATSITAPVPAGATTGNVIVTAGGQASNSLSFTVTIPPPSITSLTPASGPVGTSVTIAGANFAATQGTSTVTFNGISAAPTSWSASSIVVPVPAGATTGNVIVTVGGQASNGSNFTITTPAGIHLVQHAGKDAGVTNSSTLVFPSNNTAGNFIAVVIRAGRSGQVFTVSDTRGNTYRSAIQFNVTTDTPTGDTLGVFYAENIASGANTVTVAESISGNTLRFVILEYSGVAPANSLDVVSTAQGTSAIANSGNALTTANGDLLLGTIVTGNPATDTAATGYTIEERVPASPNTKLAAEDQIQAAAATVSAGVTFSASDSWGAGLAAFKAASGGGTTGPSISSLNPTAGVVGSSVIITGTNFGAAQGTSTVTFNGTAATPTNWSTTSIAVTVPTGATTGGVVVTVGGTASNGVTFTVTLPPPSITSLNPTSGLVGTSVTIAGTNFGVSQGTSTVKFNGIAAAPTSWSATSIAVPVPTGATTGNVVVTVGGAASNSVTFVVLIPPSITSLTPNSGTVGTSITIAGANFGTSQGTSTVTFNGTAATPTSWTATSIAVPVPTGAATGSVVVTVGGLASNGVNFTVVVPPSIASLTPNSGMVGMSVTIAGTNFGASQGASTVTFNGITATPTSWSVGSITAPVPNGATTGNVVVTVSGVASNGSLFTVTSSGPSLTSLGLTQGPVGAVVTITGTNFGATQGTSNVTFNGTIGTPSSWTATSIDVPVPVGATTGSVIVTVGGVASNGLLFTVTPPPNITSISPVAGPIGTLVTINGTNFGPTVGTRVSGVTFNGVAARTNSWSDTQILLPVPAGATTGNVVVSISGVPSNGVNFTVTAQPTITALNPTSGPVGTSVAITGTNFSATQGTSTVTFNGVAATPTIWNDTNISASVPTGASTGNVVVTVGGLASNGVNFTVNSSGAPIGFIQSNFAVPHPSATTVTIPFSAPQNAGDLNVVVVGWNDSAAQISSVTDSAGNAYTLAVGPTVQVGFATQSIYYAKNIASGAANANVVSVTFSAAANAPDIRIAEYSNVDPVNAFDASAAAQGSSVLASSGTVTTTSANDLLVGANLVQTTTTGSGAGFTSRVITNPDGDILEDRVVTSAGSYTATAPDSPAGSWIMQVAAFRAVNGAPPPPISVSVAPPTASVTSGGASQGFTATLQNDIQNKGVTWSLSGAGCTGNACGTLSAITATTVSYSAPPSLPNPPTVALTATSVADNTKSATATITVTQGTLSVAISPARAAVTYSQPQQFTATVFNDPQNKGVTWMVDGNNGGNGSTGTVSTSGLFKPGTQAGQHTVTAVSVSNASVTASATIAVTDLLGVLTYHYDVARTGQTLKEYALAPSTVSSSTFGRLFSCPLDGYVYAQPLYVANLTIASVTRNVVILATEHDSVYAFDADSSSCTQLWKTSFLASGVTTMPWQDTSLGTSSAATDDVFPEIGITSTPVVDLATNTIYLVAKTKETVGTGCSGGSPCYVSRLHALDLLTGLDKFGGPTVISAPNFVSLRHFNRPGLLLANGTLYIAFGSHGDISPWFGWLFGYDPATLARKFVFSTSDPTNGSNGASIWGGGAGPAADASGNVYVSTGNGAYDGTKNFSESTLKISPTGSLLDWFTPFNRATLDANDVDLGSSGVVVLPDSVGSAAHPHLALATGKIAVLFLLDQNSMGKFNSGSNLDVQEVIPVPPPNTTQLDGGNYGVPAYWNGNIYTTGQNFPVSQFKISNGNITAPAFAVSSNTFPARGATPAVSANGAANGIVWVLDLSGWPTGGNAILNAYDASNIANLLFSSPSSGSGAAGPAVKFTVPTVANGKVYVGGQGVFTVFGLLP